LVHQPSEMVFKPSMNPSFVRRTWKNRSKGNTQNKKKQKGNT
jgi:hypothetical protein